MEEYPRPPPGQPGYGPPPGTPISKGSGLSRVRLRNPLSIVLIALIVIGFVAAGLLASELVRPSPRRERGGRRHRMRGAG